MQRKKDAAICKCASSVQSIASEGEDNTIYGLTIEEIRLTTSQSRFAAVSTFEHIASLPPNFPYPKGLIEINTKIQERSRNKREMKQSTTRAVYTFI